VLCLFIAARGISGQLYIFRSLSQFNEIFAILPY
jgi:hypothetical protein